MEEDDGDDGHGAQPVELRPVREASEDGDGARDGGGGEGRRLRLGGRRRLDVEVVLAGGVVTNLQLEVGGQGEGEFKGGGRRDYGYVPVLMLLLPTRSDCEGIE